MSDFDSLIQLASQQYKVDPDLVRATLQVESGMNPNAVGPATKYGNALGIGQFIPATAKALGIDPTNPAEAIQGTARLIAENLNRYGNVEDAIRAYHGGTDKSNWGAKTEAYVGKVKKAYDMADDPFAGLQKTAAAKPSKYVDEDPFSGLSKEPAKNTTPVKQEKVYAPTDVAMSILTRGLSGYSSSPHDFSGTNLGRLISAGIGAGEAGLSALSGAIAVPVSAAAQLGYNILHGIRGDSPDQSVAAKTQEALTLQPRTSEGKEYLQKISSLLDLTKLPPVMPEALGGQVGKPVKSVGKSKFAIAPEVAPNVASKVAPTELVGVGAAETKPNPFKFTGEELARGAYPSIKLSQVPTDVAPAEQVQRALIHNEIVGDNEGMRSGVLTGNEQALRNEYTEAKQSNQTPRAELLRQQIAKEQKALSDYAQKRIENTGADQLLQNDYQRGQRIADAFSSDEGLRGFFKQKKQEIYNKAAQTVGDNPVGSESLDALLNSDKFKAELKLKGIKDFTEGLSDLLNEHKTKGFEVSGEQIAPNSIAGLEELRKSLNRQWTKDNSWAIGKAIEAIDSDIAKAGGPGLYKEARAVHQAEKTLFGSKGIKTLFGDIDPNGIPTATAFEDIPKKLNNMPVDQWKHIYDTADMLSSGHIKVGGQMIEITPELQEAAQAAKAEIAGAVARKIYESGAGKAGEWNQNSVNKTLNALSEKIKHSFPLDEQQAFHKLNYGGYMMPGVHSYEGAAMQSQRLGAIANKLPVAGSAVGGFLGSPFGPVGSGIGAAAGEKLGERGASLLNMRKMQNEAAALEKEMKNNANLPKLMQLRDKP